MDYTIGNLAFMPGILVCIFIGTTISDLSDAAKGKQDNNAIVMVMLIVGSILACAGVVWISIVAKRKLKA